MPAALIALPALLLAAVLIVSGIAKLRRPDDLSGWADMGVPAPLRRAWMLRLHPWAEIAVGIVLAAFGGLPGEIAAVAALALMVAYLVMVVRVLRAGSDASCACFGAPRRVTRVTAVRNGWYVLLALAAAATAWTAPPISGAVAVTGWAGMLGLAAAGITVALTMWQAPADPATSEASASGDDLLDYLRSPTPAVPLLRADGEQVNLRELTSTQPLLLLAVRAGCGSCEQVLASVPQWRALLPGVPIRLLLREEPDSSTATETADPQSLHDPHHYAYDSLGIRTTPSAVLLGADGMLAGGPVAGTAAITEFISDVYESLHGERPPSQA